jgi:hypothetical protein
MESVKLTKNGNQCEMHLHFGWGALRHWTNATGNSISDLERGKEMTVEETMWLIWAGLKQGAYKAGQPFDTTIDDVADLMDENPTLIMSAMELFAQSLPQAEAPNAAAGAAHGKKKVSR